MFLPAMVIELEPYQLADVPGLFVAWLQAAGGFTAVGLALALLSLIVGQGRPGARWSWPARVGFLGLAAMAALAYGLIAVLRLPSLVASVGALLGGAAAPPTAPWSPLEQLALTLGGASAVLAALLPLALDVGRFRLGRIGALALLTFREAVRRQVFWAYAILIVVFLFASWFVGAKPEGQLQTYVWLVYLTILLLLLLSQLVLASFSIPADIQNQTIHTILTKPVERFEIVLGRFAGNVGLMTVTLLAMTCLSFLYVYANGVHPDAEKESLRARVPIYGQLKFLKKGQEAAGDSVGREWEYRQYVAGGKDSTSRAVWNFDRLPSDTGRAVPCEFSFDIFRMTKGEEGKGVYCSLSFATPRWDESRRNAFTRDRDAERAQPTPRTPAEIDDRLAEKYGLYEVPFKEIVNGHTFAVEVPAGLLTSAREASEGRRSAGPLLTATLKCESPTQFIGVARHDLYLLEDDGSFLVNFFKGVVGIWFQLLIVIGVALAASTYLSGVISLVCVLFLYGSGWCREFILEIAERRSEGGGPAESAYRVFYNQNGAMPLPEGINQVTTVFDEVFRWVLWRFLNLAPDVRRLDYHAWVGAGFSVTPTDLGIGLLLTLGYVLPWLVLSYYLIRWREVAA